MMINAVIFRYLSEWIYEIPFGNIEKSSFALSLSLPRSQDLISKMEIYLKKKDYLLGCTQCEGC